MLQRLKSLLSQMTAGTPPAQRAARDPSTAGWALYHFDACPFCWRVRRAVGHLGLSIELRDIQQNSDWRRELIAGGGRSTVPCLRRPGPNGADLWMYESADIVAFLNDSFARGD